MHNRTHTTKITNCFWEEKKKKKNKKPAHPCKKNRRESGAGVGGKNLQDLCCCDVFRKGSTLPQPPAMPRSTVCEPPPLLLHPTWRFIAGINIYIQVYVSGSTHSTLWQAVWAPGVHGAVAIPPSHHAGVPHSAVTAEGWGEISWPGAGGWEGVFLRALRHTSGVWTLWGLGCYQEKKGDSPTLSIRCKMSQWLGCGCVRKAEKPCGTCSNSSAERCYKTLLQTACVSGTQKWGAGGCTAAHPPPTASTLLGQQRGNSRGRKLPVFLLWVFPLLALPRNMLWHKVPKAIAVFSCSVHCFSYKRLKKPPNLDLVDTEQLNAWLLNVRDGLPSTQELWVLWPFAFLLFWKKKLKFWK